MQQAGGTTFSEDDCRAIYRVIHERRDVRSEFLPTPIPDDVLGRLLEAAHHAPSVGFMQPWDFLLVNSIEVRQQIHAHVCEMKRRANIYENGRRDLYQSLKLEGILEAPLNVCVTCDRERRNGRGLGRQTDAMTDLYSTVCAVQNFWLAARAESIGVGWVSILDLETVKRTLNIPERVQIVAYLCVGYVSDFRSKPELETAGWESRTQLKELLHFDSWNNQDATRTAAICGV